MSTASLTLELSLKISNGHESSQMFVAVQMLI